MNDNKIRQLESEIYNLKIKVRRKYYSGIPKEVIRNIFTPLKEIYNFLDNKCKDINIPDDLCNQITMEKYPYLWLHKKIGEILKELK